MLITLPFSLFNSGEGNDQSHPYMDGETEREAYGEDARRETIGAYTSYRPLKKNYNFEIRILGVA